MDETDKHYDVIIIGSGVAGLSAATYTSRGGNETLILRGDSPGGQLTLTTEVENYPGFPEGLSGPELIDRMEKQCEKFGTEIENGVVTDIDRYENSFEIILTDDTVYSCNAIIAASGSSARLLGIDGEDELMGYGVSTCATCDGAFFRDKDMIVVGGGDAAFEEAHFLTKFANTVHLIHRRENFRAEEYWQDKVHEKVESGDIKIHKNSELYEIDGTKEDGIDEAVIVTNDEGYPRENIDSDQTEKRSLDVEAVFIAIGHVPNTSYLQDTGVELDSTGYIVTNGGVESNSTQTTVEGIFGAGDVVDHNYQQAVTAAGMGVKSALDVDEYLSDQE